MPRLFLIDGYALIYRAFYAMISRPLRTAKGENTSVPWGIANFLMRLNDQHHPDYLAWVNDAGDSFRTEEYPEYKSTREKLDDELQADFDRSVGRVEQLLEAFRVPLVEAPGYEADDVIGTLANQGAAAGLDVVIVSGDKDFYQLIGPKVSLLNPGRGGPAGVDSTWVDSSNAEERLGVPPSQVVDFLALVGDSSDNVPGVKGIGAKGARELLQQYGDLDTLLEKAEEVAKKRPREALLAYADEARLSRSLVTIKVDVPLEVDIDELKSQDPDLELLTPLLTELEFYSLVESLGVSDEAAAVSLPEVTVIDEPEALADLVKRLRQAQAVALMAVGSESSSRSAALVGIALATSDGAVCYLPLGHESDVGALAAPEPVRNLPPLGDELCQPLADWLGDERAAKTGHDLKRTWQLVRGAGIELAGVRHDTMLESFVLDPGRRSHSLANLTLDLVRLTLPTKQDVVGKGKKAVTMAQTDIGQLARYAGSRAWASLQLHGRFQPELTRLELLPLLEELEVPLIEVLVDMEWAGIAVDRAVLSRLSRQYGEELARLQEQVTSAAGQEFNINSPKQLATILFEKEQLPVIKKTKTGPSTDADVLAQLAAMGHEVPRLILAYRELQKLLSTYIDTLPQAINEHTGRIHTTFNQAGAATGRLSSNDPNLQNIPVRTAKGEEIRRAFVPAEGWRLVVADYSQIELRLLAHLAQDPLLIEAFEQGGDIHRQTAALIFEVPLDGVTAEMRSQAKTINFATIYGQGPFALSKQLGIAQAEAKEFITQYFERFAGVRQYLDSQVELARDQGYVETLFGRRRYINEINDKNFNVRSFGERTAQNTPLQGSAADLIKRAMRTIHDDLRGENLESRLLLQVHDELVLEAPPSEVDRVSTLVKRAMEEAMELRVPLVAEVGVGANWLDAKS